MPLPFPTSSPCSLTASLIFEPSSGFARSVSNVTGLYSSIAICRYTDSVNIFWIADRVHSILCPHVSSLSTDAHPVPLLVDDSFPPHYKDLTANNLPPELLPKYSTIEYTLSRPAPVPPIFLYVVDTCLDADDLKALRDVLVVSLSMLPPHALVGLITYGTMVSSFVRMWSLRVCSDRSSMFNPSRLSGTFIFCPLAPPPPPLSFPSVFKQTQVHEIGYSSCPKSYVFRGSKEYAPKQISDMLGLNSSNRPAPRPGQPMGPASFGASRFLMPVAQCEFQLTSLLENLQRDSWPVANDKRALRCTGVAMSVAVGMLEVSHSSLYRVMSCNE